MNSYAQVFLNGGVIIVSAFLYLSSLALASDEKYNRASLRGLKGVYVSVEKLGSDIERDGLTRDRLRKEVESKLRMAGIKILSRKQWSDVEGNPYLYVNANVLKLRETREYIYSINIAFKQDVYPLREPGIVWGASTWSVGGIIGITPRLDKIHAAVKGKVEQFINAYLSVNPK